MLGAQPHGADPTHVERGSASSALWGGTDVLLERAPIQGVITHKLGPLAAVRLRRLGEPIPEVLRAEERAALLGMRMGAALVERIRAAYDGPLMLLKGPEVADLYPSRARRFSDIDVLTRDADRVYRTLLGAGFLDASDEQGVPDQHHHLEPLRWPTISLKLEIHSAPNWLPSMRPPPLEEILEGAIPSTLEIEGITAPTPLHHTLMLVSHAWRDEPLHTLRDLVDIAAMAARVGRAELDHTAAAWGMERVWQATWRAIEHVLYDGRSSFPLRSWARHLAGARERSILEHHLVRWLSPYSEFPPRLAFARMARVAREEVEPAAGESWGEKLGRVTSALRNPSAPVARRPRDAEGHEANRHEDGGA